MVLSIEDFDAHQRVQVPAPAGFSPASLTSQSGVLVSTPCIGINPGAIMQEQTLTGYTPVSDLTTEARSTFISRTYSHVAGAILLFTVIEMYLFNSGLVVPLSQFILSFNWLIVIG